MKIFPICDNAPLYPQYNNYRDYYLPLRCPAVEVSWLIFATLESQVCYTTVVGKEEDERTSGDSLH